MKMLIYFVLLVALWITFILAYNEIYPWVSFPLLLWFITINSVVTVKLLIDLHSTRGKL
jgi:hypothetical protein